MSEQQNINKKLDLIAKMSKIDLPNALTFFLGKDQAKEIKRKVEIRSSQKANQQVNTGTSSYGNIICDHSTTQVKT